MALPHCLPQAGSICPWRQRKDLSLPQTHLQQLAFICQVTCNKLHLSKAANYQQHYISNCLWFSAYVPPTKSCPCELEGIAEPVLLGRGCLRLDNVFLCTASSGLEFCKASFLEAPPKVLKESHHFTMYTLSISHGVRANPMGRHW